MLANKCVASLRALSGERRMFMLLLVSLYVAGFVGRPMGTVISEVVDTCVVPFVAPRTNGQVGL
jgi:hypothetical protein